VTKASDLLVAALINPELARRSAATAVS